jgi:DHA3 family tetracycline resistance protein-like MFS transporter
MLRLDSFRLDAFRLFLIMGAADSLFAGMIFTGLTVYYIQTVGMNPLQLVLVGTAVELTILLFEVPTGVLADTYSRRLSVIIGIALVGICYVIQGSVAIFAIIIVAEIIRGIGETFRSGAESAWITDEIGEERVGLAFLRGSQVGRIGRFAGIGVAVTLGSINLSLPIILGGALQIALSLFLVVTMPEKGFRPAPRQSGEAPWSAMRRLATEGVRVVRGRPVVWMLFLVGLVFGAFSEGIDRLGEAHFLTSFNFPAWTPFLANLQPVVWIGIIEAGGMLLSIAVAEILIRRWRLEGNRRVGPLLLANSAGLMLSVVAFGLAPNFGIALAAMWTVSVLRSVQYPIAATWLNQHLPSHVRATVLSMVGQADALGQVAGGPIVGVVALRSLRAALVFSGLILTPALALYSRGVKLEESAESILVVAEAADAPPSSM